MRNNKLFVTIWYLACGCMTIVHAVLLAMYVVILKSEFNREDLLTTIYLFLMVIIWFIATNLVFRKRIRLNDN